MAPEKDTLMTHTAKLPQCPHNTCVGKNMGSWDSPRLLEGEVTSHSHFGKQGLTK